MVKMMIIIFLWLWMYAEMRCPIIAHTNQIMIMLIEDVLWKISIPISNIFCPIAVDIARNVPIGISNCIYFLLNVRMFGSVVLMVCINGLLMKFLSYGMFCVIPMIKRNIPMNI